MLRNWNKNSSGPERTPEEHPDAKQTEVALLTRVLDGELRNWNRRFIMNSMMNTGKYKEMYKKLSSRIKRNGKRITSLFLCAAVMASLISCGSAPQDTNTAVIAEGTEEKVLEQVLNGQVSASHSSEAGKEETVYVMADAGGKVDRIIVSDWVKNADGSHMLTDASDLKDIQNVKGYEGFTAGSDGTLTWDANGADIYYQGTTEKELPVEVKISYTLDGEEIAPEMLAGKSGKVTIRFDYENRQTETVDINGSKEEVYVPFAMISGMVLPEENFSNIEVTNAKLISEGSNNLVVGVAFPGLKESLKLDELKEEIDDKEKKEELDELEIPDYIEVSADATDFSLNMTMTMAMSDVLSEIALTDSIDISDMQDSMEELKDASEELTDGTGRLKDGTEELRDGTVELLDGSIELKDGTHKLLDGTVTLKDGTAELRDGTGELKNGTGELKDGTGELKSGAGELKDGTSQLADGTGKLKDGADTLKAGTQELYDKSGELNTGARTLDAGTAQLMEGSKQLAMGTSQLAEGSLQLDAGAAQIQAGLTSVDTAIQTMVGACEGNGQTAGLVGGAQSLAEGMAGLDALLNQYFQSYEADISSRIAALQAMKASAEAQAAEAQAMLEEAQAVQAEAAEELSRACEPTSETRQVEVTAEGKGAQMVTASGQISEIEAAEITAMADVEVESVSAERVMEAAEEYRAASQQVAECQAQAAAAQAQADAAAQMIGQITQGYAASGAFSDVNQAQQAAYITYIKQAVGNLNQGAQAVSTGVSGIYGGLKALSDGQQGVPALAAGADVLKQGTEAAVAGTKELNAGAQALDTGIGTVKAGTGELAAGTVKLAEGAGTLNMGAGVLKEGIAEADSGARKLDEGAGKLNDGAAKLDEGAVKLDDGAGRLDEGAVKLDDGAAELKDGAAELDDGAAELKDGVVKLKDGAEELDDGAAELKDGMIRFDEEGISKLTDLFGDNVKEVLDRIDAVKEAGSNYNTFTKLPEGSTGSVRFIYKTDAVKAE